MTQIGFSQAVKEKEARIQEHRIDSMLQMIRSTNGIRQDALQFTKAQLESMSQTIYDVLYSNPRDAFRFLPLNTEPSDGETIYSYRMMSKLGAARIVADGATDRPLVDADLTKHTRDIYELGAGYTFTIGDQARSGAILDFNYVQEKARIAAETIALGHNEYALFGGAGVTDGPAAITGFLNNATVIANAPTLTDSTWATAPVGTDQYLTIRDLINDVNSGSAGVHSATDVILSTYVWNTVSGTLLNSAASSQTVLSALRQNYPEITFHKSASCTGAGGTNVDRCVAYERSAANMEYVAAVVYDESVPIASGFRWTVHSRGRMAGTVIRRPLAMAYGDITVA